MMEMTTTQDLRMEFNKEIETLKRAQAEMKMDLKNPITQLENSKEKHYKQNESNRRQTIRTQR